MTENEIGKVILDCAFEVHKELGPGLLESTYRSCLSHEITSKGLFVEIEKPLPVIYKNIKLDTGYRVDILVEGRVILELKSVKELKEIHLAQLLTYLKLADKKLGYLINFNVKLLKQGIRRVVNKL